MEARAARSTRFVERRPSRRAPRPLARATPGGGARRNAGGAPGLKYGAPAAPCRVPGPTLASRGGGEPRVRTPRSRALDRAPRRAETPSWPPQLQLRATLGTPQDEPRASPRIASRPHKRGVVRRGARSNALSTGSQSRRGARPHGTAATVLRFGQAYCMRFAQPCHDSPHTLLAFLPARCPRRRRTRRAAHFRDPQPR